MRVDSLLRGLAPRNIKDTQDEGLGLQSPSNSCLLAAPSQPWPQEGSSCRDLVCPQLPGQGGRCWEAGQSRRPGKPAAVGWLAGWLAAGTMQNPAWPPLALPATCGHWSSACAIRKASPVPPPPPCPFPSPGTQALLAWAGSVPPPCLPVNFWGQPVLALAPTPLGRCRAACGAQGRSSEPPPPCLLVPLPLWIKQRAGKEEAGRKGSRVGNLEWPEGAWINS